METTEQWPTPVVEGWRIFVFAPMVYDGPHARKHAMVESCARFGFEAVYVEPPNSRSRHHPYRGAPSLNDGGVRLAPPSAPTPAPGGGHVLCVPKKVRVGPARIGLGRRYEQFLQARWLERFFRNHTVSPTKRNLAIVTTARWEPLLRNVPFDVLVFDKTDPTSTLRGWLDDADYAAQEAALIARSSLVATAAAALVSDIHAAYPDMRTHVMDNGLDTAWFDRHRGEPVPELADAAGPVVGFLGTMAPWVDTDLIRTCAETHPDWTVALVGPVNSSVDVADLRALPNVRMIGPVSYERVPAVMDAFDIAIMPFRAGPVSDAANPVTLYELLYLGKPVVCTPMPTVERYADLLYMGRDNFLTNLELARVEADANLREQRSRVGRAHSWDTLVGGLLAMLPLDVPAGT